MKQQHQLCSDKTLFSRVLQIAAYCGNLRLKEWPITAATVYVSGTTFISCSCKKWIGVLYNDNIILRRQTVSVVAFADCYISCKLSGAKWTLGIVVASKSAVLQPQIFVGAKKTRQFYCCIIAIVAAKLPPVFAALTCKVVTAKCAVADAKSKVIFAKCTFVAANIFLELHTRTLQH